MNEDIQELYQELILDHFKNPRCKGCLEQADASVDVNNPLCGDEISLSLNLDSDNHLLKEVRFSGKGCSISQASASMMAEACQGKSLTEVRYLLNNFKQFLQSGSVDEHFEAKAGDLIALAGVKKFAARTRCALLAWEALRQCLEKAFSAASQAK